MLTAPMPFELRSAAGLALLGLVLPLVMLYILKIRRQRFRVASTWLWAAAARDLRARSPFRRLIPEIPLLLQLLALVALALAAGRPATRGGAVDGDHLAIVIDGSASMTAAIVAGKTRIAEARTIAHRLVDALGPGADALIVEAGPQPSVVTPLDRDRRRLHTAVDRIDAHDAPAKLGPAVALATDRLRALPGNRRIVVVTDGAVIDPEALGALSLPTDVLTVGEATPNTAIVRVDVRSGRDPVTGRAEVQGFVQVSHQGPTPREVFVTLRPRNVDQPLASRRLSLAPGERVPVILTFEPAPSDAGMGLVFEVSPGDAMAVDDRAFARVPPSRTLTAVVAPKTANPWFVRALSADPDVEVLTSTVEGLATADVPTNALVLVDGVCPERIPGADFVILDPPPGPCRTVTVAEPRDTPTITSWSETDPRLRFLTLQGVNVARAKPLGVESPRDALIRAQDSVLAADVSSPGRTGTLVGFDVGDSNWPLKASFVLFVRNLVEAARAHQEAGLESQLRTGSTLQLRVPTDVDLVTIEGPDGAKTEVRAREGVAVVAELRRAGFYFASYQGRRPGSLLIPASMASVEESDITTRELGAAGGAVMVGPASAVPVFTEWGWLCALVALGFVVLDAWWLTRRPKPRPLSAAAVPRIPERARPGGAHP
ncbi:MAG: VWA domain-containing protein [Polyangiaceae bacterium]|nr:VWA domain-containing protein [Polyangiaceae bacterium]